MGSDAETSTQRLATIQRLLTSREVLEAAGDKLPGETADTLEDKVTASVDDVASIVEVKATDGDAAGAAAIANGVAAAFLARRRAADRQRVAQTRRDLELALTRLRASGAGADEIGAVRDRLGELSLTEVTGDDLQVAEAARPAEARRTRRSRSRTRSSPRSRRSSSPCSPRWAATSWRRASPARGSSRA